MSLRYYLYISKTKVEMLHAQIPRRLKLSLALELKALGIFSAALKRETSNEDLYSKLRIVARYIERHFDIGTLDEAREYIRDVLSVRWGPFVGRGVEIVYFGGRTQHTIFGLGGSISNVVGSPGTSGTYFASASPYLLAVLSAELALPPYQHLEIQGLPREHIADNALYAVRLATEQMGGPPQKVEFLAKRLLYSPRTDTEALLLATPIYVALGE